MDPILLGYFGIIGASEESHAARADLKSAMVVKK
jgi:hypothetical protein